MKLNHYTFTLSDLPHHPPHTLSQNIFITTISFDTENSTSFAFIPVSLAQYHLLLLCSPPSLLLVLLPSFSLMSTPNLIWLSGSSSFRLNPVSLFQKHSPISFGCKRQTPFGLTPVSLFQKHSPISFGCKRQTPISKTLP